MIEPFWVNVIGFTGTACIISAYAYQTAVDLPNPFLQHGTNLVGALLLTVSLLYYTNLASLVLEGFWAAIALFGLIKAIRRSRQTSVAVMGRIQENSL